MKKINSNDTVLVNYTGRLEDGSIFDTSIQEGREPLKATLGQGQLIKGFEQGLIDMVVGEKKTTFGPALSTSADFTPKVPGTVRVLQSRRK